MFVRVKEPHNVEYAYRSKNARKYSKHKIGTTRMSTFLMTLLSSTFGNISFAVRDRVIVLLASTSSLTHERRLGESDDNNKNRYLVP